LEQVQKIQADIWQALRIGELQRLYSGAKETLPERARALLDPLEELSSRILYNRNDLKRFLKQWEKLSHRVQKLRSAETDAARHWLDEMHNIQSGVRLTDRVNEWQEAYARLRGSLPSKASLRLIKFDAINHRVVYSRQELQRVWSQTISNTRQLKLWQIRPWRITKAMIQDFSLTTSFAANFKEFARR
jgi:hypothetical protein